MANEEHRAMLKKDVEFWNQWRQENPTIKPDLSNADFSRDNLRKADLTAADLSGAYLLLTDFTAAKLRGANLRHADLRSAALCDVDLTHTIFSHANLRRADLRGANLDDADLNGADLYRSLLNRANLRGAKLNGVILRDAQLSGAKLNDADLTDAIIGWTIFGNVDLSGVKGLETINHQGPSTIGIDTITSSQGKIPEIFLKGAGVPDIFITYMQSLTGAAFDFYSCFISYSSKDKAFAERLHADLQAKGVRTWYAPEDLKIGEVMLSGIDKGIQLHDKLLVVLSEHSVTSKWVEHEVEAALYEEAQPERKTQVLFPIRLDDTVMDTKVNWAYRIRQRHIGDFTQWKDHDAYQKAFARLLGDLKQGSGT